MEFDQRPKDGGSADIGKARTFFINAIRIQFK
jgi:hypothetical protein